MHVTRRTRVCHETAYLQTICLSATVSLAACPDPIVEARIVFFCWAGYLLPTDIAASTHPPTYSSRNASHEAPTHPQKVSPQVVCIGTMALAGPLRLRRLIVRVVPAPPARCRRTPPHRALLSQLSPSGNFKQLTGPTHGPDSDGAAPLRPPSGRRKMHRLLLRRRRNFFSSS